MAITTLGATPQPGRSLWGPVDDGRVSDAHRTSRSPGQIGMFVTIRSEIPSNGNIGTSRHVLGTFVAQFFASSNGSSGLLCTFPVFAVVFATHPVASARKFRRESPAG